MKPSRFDSRSDDYSVERSRFLARIQINNEREKRIGDVLIWYNSLYTKDRVDIVPEKFSKLVEIVKDSDDIDTIIEKYKNIEL